MALLQLKKSVKPLLFLEVAASYYTASVPCARRSKAVVWGSGAGRWGGVAAGPGVGPGGRSGIVAAR